MISNKKQIIFKTSTLIENDESEKSMFACQSVHQEMFLLQNEELLLSRCCNITTEKVRGSLGRSVGDGAVVRVPNIPTLLSVSFTFSFTHRETLSSFFHRARYLYDEYEWVRL